MTKWLIEKTWRDLKLAGWGGHRNDTSLLLSNATATKELAWINDALFIFGIDKATSNPSFICIKHIGAEALIRLQEAEWQSVAFIWRYYFGHQQTDGHLGP